MKKERTVDLVKGRRIIPQVMHSMAAKEGNCPFVDKTRTMTGRVSENI